MMVAENAGLDQLNRVAFAASLTKVPKYLGYKMRRSLPFLTDGYRWMITFTEMR